MAGWVEACEVDEIDEEDVIRFDHAGRTFAIYCSPARRILRHAKVFAHMSRCIWLTAW